MDVTSAPAGSAQSSFLSFATVLADVRHLSLAERLSSGDAAGPEDSSESSQLGTAMRFAQTCLERAAAAEGAEVGFAMSTKLAADATDFDTDDGQEEDRNNWILEARTWELLHYLCADRYLQRDQSEVRPDSSRDEEGPFVPGSQNLADLYYQTPFAAVQDILLSNRELRELKIVRDWLSSQLPAVHIAEVRKGYAPFSKNRLRAEKRTHVVSRTARASTTNGTLIVRNLDPDAELRGQGKWDLEDSNYSKALHRTLFEYARSGQLAAAFDLCRQADQPWRAASLRGAMLYHQQALNGEPEGDDEMLPGEISGAGGNRNRLLWKAVCKRLAANPSLEPYERALYGSLAGHLASVIAVSSPDSWEEHVWAHINACLETRIEAAFEEQGTRNGPGSWWTQEGGKGSVRLAELRSEQVASIRVDVRTELRDIFSQVKGTASGASSKHSSSSHWESIRLQADNPYRVVQQAIILDELPELLIHVESRLTEMLASIPPKRYAHLVRFFAHLVLYLRLLGKSQLPASSCNSILRHYVEVLEHVAQSRGAPGAAASEEGELVAMYASSLERESAEESYAHYLKGLNETASIAEKRSALLKAQQHEVDVAAVARSVVQVIFAESYPLLQQQSAAISASSANGALKSGLDNLVSPTQTESRLISSIEWLTFLADTRSDAVFQSNALMRALLSRGRIHAARTLLYSLPGDLLDSKDDNLLGLRSTDRTEQLHYHSFFHLLSTHLALVELLSQKPLSTVTSTVKRTDLFAWRRALVDLAQRIKLETEELLKGEWLKLNPEDEEKVDDIEEQDDEEQEQEEGRQIELARIRQLYVPEVVLRLHFLLSDAHASLRAFESPLPSSGRGANSQAEKDGSGADAKALLDYITAELPVLVADERYKVYLEFVTSGAAASNNRLQEYLRHVRDAYLVKLGEETNDGDGNKVVGFAGSDTGVQDPFA